MQVILTPTAVADMFGPGLNGFKGDVPPLPPPTQVSAEWLNSVQMELVSAILDQGIALDAYAFDQLTQALNNWQWSGSPTVKTGATLFVQNGAFIEVEAGGELVTNAGSQATFNGSSRFNGIAEFLNSVEFANSVVFGSTVEINGAVDLNANLDFGANTIQGIGGTIAASTVIGTVTQAVDIETDTITFDDDGLSGTANGRLAYDGYTLTLGNGTVARRVVTPVEAYAVAATTSALADIPGVSVTMTIDNNQWVLITLNFVQLVVTSGSAPSIRITASNGVDTVDVVNNTDLDQGQRTFPVSTANNQYFARSLVVRWKPTNDVVAPANTNWTIRARHFVSAGNVTTSNVHLQVRYN